MSSVRIRPPPLNRKRPSENWAFFSLPVGDGNLRQDVDVQFDAERHSRVLNFSSTRSNLILERLTVYGGRSATGGGGIRFNSSVALVLIGSTVSGNSTTGLAESLGWVNAFLFQQHLSRRDSN